MAARRWPKVPRALLICYEGKTEEQCFNILLDFHRPPAYVDEGCINIWKCDMCDRFMVFDTEPHVTRYMKRICVDDLPENQGNLPRTEGYIYNNLLFKAVDGHYTREWERSGRAFNYTWSYLSPRRIREEVFSGKNGRYRDWWYCRNYTDYIVFNTISGFKAGITFDRIDTNAPVTVFGCDVPDAHEEHDTLYLSV